MSSLFYPVTTYLPDMRRQVKSCPDVTLAYAVVRAARIFCRDSEEYEMTINLPLVNDLEIYKLDINTNDEIIRIKDVQYNGQPMASARPEDVWFNKTGDQPFTFIFEPPDMLMLKPIPHNTSGPGNLGQTNNGNLPTSTVVLASTATQLLVINASLTVLSLGTAVNVPVIGDLPDVCLVRVILQPLESATMFADILYRTYKEVITSGALAWVYSMQGEVWYNPQLSAAAQARFDMECSNAKRRRQFGHTSRSVRARPRSFLFGG